MTPTLGRDDRATGRRLRGEEPELDHRRVQRRAAQGQPEAATFIEKLTREVMKRIDEITAGPAE